MSAQHSPSSPDSSEIESLLLLLLLQEIESPLGEESLVTLYVCVFSRGCTLVVLVSNARCNTHEVCIKGPVSGKHGVCPLGLSFDQAQ